MIDKPIFFVHIQKTAGGTLRVFTRRQMEVGAVYPEAADGIDRQTHKAYWSIPRLMRLPAERRAQIRAYIGHYPYCASQMLGIDLFTVTLLRDPIERTISYLKMRAAGPGRRDWPIEKIYDDPIDFHSGILNHQTRIYSLTESDRPRSFLRPIDLDEDRLALAKENLRATDLVGVQERFDEFLDEYCERTGLSRDTPVEARHVAPIEIEISPSIRDRIIEDTAMDAELHRYAVALIDERRAQRRTTATDAAGRVTRPAHRG